MRATQTQTNFTGGVLSGKMFGRSDINKYANGLEQLDNGIVFPQGGASKRPGTAYIQSTRGNNYGRLLSFQFNDEEAYVLEMTDGWLRFYRDGGRVDGSLVVDSITVDAGTVYIYETAAAHGLVVGESVSMAGSTPSGYDGTFTVTAIVNGTEFKVDVGTNPAAYTGGTGTLTLPYSVAHPYAEAELDAVRYTQSADTLYLCHPKYIPRTLERTGADVFTLSAFQFADGPYEGLDVSGTTMTLSGGSYGAGDTVTVTASVSFFDNANSTDLGKMMRFQETAVWNYGIITAINSATEVDVYMVTEATGGAGAADGFQIGSWGGAIDSVVASTTSLTNEGTVYANYPSTVAFHQQRIWFANLPNNTQRIMASETGDFVNFAPSDPATGDVVDTSALDYTIATNQVNAVYWMRSSAKGLMIGTVGEEHMLQSSSAFDPITPTNVKMEVQTAHGSRSTVRPIQVGSVVLFAHRVGEKLREFSFQFEADQYVSADLNLLSEDLGKKKVKYITYQEEPSSLVWCVCEDGELIVLTYERTQEVTAWTKCVISGGFVESAETTPETSDDTVWFIVKRTINGSEVRYVEALQRQFDTGDNQGMSWFVDSGLSYNGINAITNDFLKVTEISSGGYLENASVTLAATGHTPFSGTSADVDTRYRFYIGEAIYDVQITAHNSTSSCTAKLLNDFPASIQNANIVDWAALSGAPTGLGHLEGESVTVLADGGTHPLVTVSGGVAALQGHYAELVIGLGYAFTLKTMPIRITQFPVDARGKWTNAFSVGFRYLNSLGGTAKNETGRTYNIPYRVQSDPLGRPPSIQTGYKTVRLGGGYDENGVQITVNSTDALPFTLLNVVIEADVNAAV